MPDVGEGAAPFEHHLCVCIYVYRRQQRKLDLTKI